MTDRDKTIWLVEVRHTKRGPWKCTVGAALVKSDALRELRDWRSTNPYDEYRLARYRRVGK